MIRRIAASLAVFALAITAGAEGAAAQDSGFSAPGAGAHLNAEQAASFSKQVERDLAAKGAHLAIVFRTGRARKDLPEGISYTHGAFWAFQPIKLDDGREINGYAVYNLYAGDGKSVPKDKSYLHQDFPIDFVAGTAVDDVAVIIPSPEMQRRILEVMASPTYAKLHQPDYSLISNPLNLKYQNCNEFMLDIIAAAAWETSDIKQINVDLRAHFKPTVVKTGPLQRLFGPMVDSRLKTDDQKGKIVTATYESMAAFMKDNGLLQETYVFLRDPRAGKKEAGD
jgi:hypothetical protein